MTQLLSNWLQAHSSSGGCISPDMAPCFCPSNIIPPQTQADFLPPTSTKINFLVKPKFYFFFLRSESPKLLRVCVELWDWERSQRDKKREKEQKGLRGSAERERQKESETERDRDTERHHPVV